jgi:hypothetical protein
MVMMCGDDGVVMVMMGQSLLMVECDGVWW